jgi:hypothetical protein
MIEDYLLFLKKAETFSSRPQAFWISVWSPRVIIE